jgi:hypothetical protein
MLGIISSLYTRVGSGCELVTQSGYEIVDNGGARSPDQVATYVADVGPVEFRRARPPHRAESIRWS